MFMISLALAVLFFVGIHIGVAGSTLRERLVARFGFQAYMIVFSVVSMAGIIWLASAYGAAEYRPLWGMLQWWKPFAIALMLPAFLLVVIGLTTPNPTAVGQEGRVDRPPFGIVRVTRHPFLVGVAIWAGVHLVGNGDLASLLLFGGMLVVSAAGTVSIDAKRRRTVGAKSWDVFAGQTSILPFGAILSGRGTLALAEIGLWRPAAGVLAYVLMLGGHKHIIGVSPFPW
jgi:uncharacterized membrane protein